MSGTYSHWKGEKDEPEIFGEAKHATRNVAQFWRRLREAPCWPKLFPASLLSAGVPGRRQQAATAQPTVWRPCGADGRCPDPGATAAEKLTLLSGPGGNVVVLNGPDAKSWSTRSSAGLAEVERNARWAGNAPLKTVIDTHWHFDHTDNNANLHAAGGTVLAHENTKTRMAEPHDSALLGLHIPASPADALPQQTFSTSPKTAGHGEIVMLQYFQPAHTDTDIYIHFQKANVIHMGDTFFNGFYPVIDASTGGKIDGMIVAATKFCPWPTTTPRSFRGMARWATKPI